MKAARQLLLTLIVLLVGGPAAQADFLIPLSQQAVLAQAVFADLMVAGAALDQNPNASFDFTYNGSTVGTTFSGSLAGQFNGVNGDSGSISGIISNPGTDSDYTITGGGISVGKTPYGLSGKFTIDDKTATMGTVNLTLTNPAGNVTWKNQGAMDVKLDADGNWVFTGTVRWTNGLQQMKDYMMTITYNPGNPFVQGSKESITSKLDSLDGKTTYANNKGTPVTQVGLNYDGTMSLDIAAVPEPSSLVLGALGLFGLAAGYRWRKRGTGSSMHAAPSA